MTATRGALRALAVLEALGLRWPDDPAQVHNFIQKANNAVYLAQELGVDCGYTFGVR